MCAILHCGHVIQTTHDILIKETACWAGCHCSSDSFKHVRARGGAHLAVVAVTWVVTTIDEFDARDRIAHVMHISPTARL